jgi:hypothetical protein
MDFYHRTCPEFILRLGCSCKILLESQKWASMLGTERAGRNKRWIGKRDPDFKD